MSLEKEKRARFRFKAEIYDTYKNEANITFYVLTVKIYGLNIDEYEIKKRFSEFAEYDSRLKSRFHHKRLPQLPSKTLTKSAKHDDEFISKRKSALNRYLRGIGQRLYLQNSEASWHFFDFVNKINPYLHRYRVLYLKSIQCNDYEFIDADDIQSAPKSSGFSLRSLFSTKASTKPKKTILREWRVIYAAFIEANIYLSVSTIYSDNTKNNWWNTFVSTANDTKSALIAKNPVTNSMNHDTNMDENVTQQAENLNSRQDRLESMESIDFDTCSDLNNKNSNNNNATSAKSTASEASIVLSKGGLSAWEAEKLAIAENEFYLGKIEVFKWTEDETEAESENENKSNILYTSHCRFPLVRNRPSSALFLARDNLLLVGTSHGKILCFKLDEETHTLSHICYLPLVFGGYVTDLIGVECEHIYYQAAALAIRPENPLPRGSKKCKSIGSSFIYAVSDDCHLSVFDLRSGDCIGYVQTGITGNLSIAYCCEKLFVSNRNNIVVFIRSSKTGDPVPQTELIGHRATVFCLHSDKYNRRLFSGSGDNSLAVWYYDKLQDTMLQVQQLKSVNKSSKFTCITSAPNINCVIAGSDNGFITIWHEYDTSCDELSDKIYDLQMSQLDTNRESEEKQEEIVTKRGAMDVSDEIAAALTQQEQILKTNERKFDGSISSKKSSKNMVWKCVYTWKAHKGAVNNVSYNEKYNLLMSTSDSGQIRLVYLCDPGRVPPMQMVHSDSVWIDWMKDKLNKTFNEIQEIENNNYPNTQYQDLNLLNEYQTCKDEQFQVANENECKAEEEPPIKTEIKDEELLQHQEKVTDDIWNDNNNDDDDTKAQEEMDVVDDIAADKATANANSKTDDEFVKQMSRHSHTSLEELL